MRVQELVDWKQERIRTLHYTWFAFFLTFVTWFNLAPLATTMAQELNWLDTNGIKILMICNVALTIPARVVIGSLLDRFGPRRIFSALLILMSIPCFVFALGNSLATLVVSRLVLSSIGAGFVIGIRMVAEWFPPKDIGFSEGFYAGWGNFGSAAAATLLPYVALDLFGGENGWRWAIALTGFMCLVYGFIYAARVQDTPPGKIFLASKRAEPMEVSSYRDLVLLIIWTIPLYAALGLLAWKLHQVEFLSQSLFYGVCIGLGLFFAKAVYSICRLNLPLLRAGIPEDDQYSFSAVAALNTTYFANFGAELAVVSMLPTFFEEIFKMTPTKAGIIASSFAFVNLVARPLGGYLSDQFTSRRGIMLAYMLGITLGFFGMSLINSAWPLGFAVLVTILCSLFVQGAEGATFAIIPLIKKRMTGKVAGMVGAYGNVGAVFYLTIYASVDAQTFFQIIAFGSGISLVYCYIFLREPVGAFEDDYMLSSRDHDLVSTHDRELLAELWKRREKR